jgi:integrase
MRDRRLRPGEYDRLMQAIATARNPLLAPFVDWAIETAMRRGEILDLRWENIDLISRMARIPKTKTGHPRTIPLTDAAIGVLREMKQARSGPPRRGLGAMAT